MKLKIKGKDRLKVGEMVSIKGHDFPAYLARFNGMEMIGTVRHVDSYRDRHYVGDFIGLTGYTIYDVKRDSMKHLPQDKYPELYI